MSRIQKQLPLTFLVFSCGGLSCLLALLASAQPQDGGVVGKVVSRWMPHNGDAVVYVEKIPGVGFPPPKAPVILDQFRLTFVPHVLPILVGTTVAFPNSDEVRHNVFSTSPPKRFNLGTYPPKLVKYLTFDKPGVVDLLCSVHSEMSAYLVVVETPYFAVTSRDGSYSITGIPPGRYTLMTWHEQLAPQSREIEVRTGVATRIDFFLRE